MSLLPKPVEKLAHELSCPICFQIFSKPVVLPCGHNYCQACISKTAASTCKTDCSPPRCPECREEFPSVDTLQRNFKLCSIIEGFLASAPELSQVPEAEAETEPEVLCDHCIDEKTLAVKSCLKCEVSLCSRHYQRHQEKDSFKSHSMVEAKGRKVCVIHRLPLEYFCSTDLSLLCSSCFVEGHHQNHDVLTFVVAEEEMRRALESRSKVRSLLGFDRWLVGN